MTRIHASTLVPAAGLALTLLLTACGGESADQQAGAPAPSADPAPAADPAASQPAVEDPVDRAAEAMTAASYRRHIEILASDEFGGRAPATPGDRHAICRLTRSW